MRPHATCIAALLLLTGSAAGAGGRLFIVGGGGTPTGLKSRMLKMARGSQSKVLIVPQASSRKEAGEESAEGWRERGATSVEVLALDDKAAAVRQVTKADVIWMPGGSQKRLMSALEGTGVPEAIRRRYVAGAMVGGTSAGAAVMSKAMISGSAETERLKRRTTEFYKGLGLWPEVIVDQHFSQRRRFNRLLSAVLDTPNLVGIGIDETTAVVVSGDRCEVTGKGSVVIVDARLIAIPSAKKGDAASAANVRLHVLRAGMTYDMKTGGVTGASE